MIIIIKKKKFVAVFQSNEILKISINSNMHARMHLIRVHCWLEAIMCVCVLEYIPYGMYNICVFLLYNDIKNTNRRRTKHQLGWVTLCVGLVCAHLC